MNIRAMSEAEMSSNLVLREISILASLMNDLRKVHRELISFQV